jgi:hypothetical protein
VRGSLRLLAIIVAIMCVTDGRQEITPEQVREFTGTLLNGAYGSIILVWAIRYCVGRRPHNRPSSNG